MLVLQVNIHINHHANSPQTHRRYTLHHKRHILQVRSQTQMHDGVCQILFYAPFERVLARSLLMDCGRFTGTVDELAVSLRHLHSVSRHIPLRAVAAHPCLEEATKRCNSGHQTDSKSRQNQGTLPCTASPASSKNLKPKSATSSTQTSCSAKVQRHFRDESHLLQSLCLRCSCLLPFVTPLLSWVEVLPPTPTLYCPTALLFITCSGESACQCSFHACRFTSALLHGCASSKTSFWLRAQTCKLWRCVQWNQNEANSDGNM